MISCNEFELDSQMMSLDYTLRFVSVFQMSP